MLTAAAVWFLWGMVEGNDNATLYAGCVLAAMVVLSFALYGKRLKCRPRLVPGPLPSEVQRRSDQLIDCMHGALEHRPLARRHTCHINARRDPDAVVGILNLLSENLAHDVAIRGHRPIDHVTIGERSCFHLSKPGQSRSWTDRMLQCERPRRRHDGQQSVSLEIEPAVAVENKPPQNANWRIPVSWRKRPRPR